VLFHVTFTVRDTFSLSEIVAVQNRIGESIQKILMTGKVMASGTFVGDRAGFFLIEAGSAEELFMMLVPLYDVAKPDITPVVPFEVLPKVFEELQKLPVK
jgi:hypothetical protein